MTTTLHRQQNILFIVFVGENISKGDEAQERARLAPLAAAPCARNSNFLQWGSPVPLGQNLCPLPKRRAGRAVLWTYWLLLRKRQHFDSCRHCSLCVPGSGAKALLFRDFSFAVLAIYLAKVKKKKNKNGCCPCQCISPGMAADKEAQPMKHHLYSQGLHLFCKFPADAPLLEKPRGKCCSGTSGSCLCQHQLSRKLDL